VLMADCCLDAYTDHGHCGVVREDGSVDNDKTIELYARAGISQASAGAQLIAPSGVMDGQVAAIRAALDEAGFLETAISLIAPNRPRLCMDRSAMLLTPLRGQAIDGDTGWIQQTLTNPFVRPY
jgi:hypothetical protein